MNSGTMGTQSAVGDRGWRWLGGLVIGAWMCGAASADWPIFRGDASLTGVAETRIPDRPQLLWTYQTGGPIKSSAVVKGSISVVGSDDGKVYAVDPSNGQVRWSYDAGSPIEASPLIVQNQAMVGTSDGSLMALALTSGEPRWSYSTDDRILGSANAFPAPHGTGTWVVVGSYDTRLHCVDAATGTRQWTYATENYINGAPAIRDGQAVFGGCDGMLHVVDVATGTRTRAVPIDAFIAGTAALDGDTAYFGHYENAFVAVDVRTGATRWTYRDRDFPYFSAPALGSDRVYFGGRDKRLHAVDRKSGAPAWTFRTRGKVDSSPVLAGDRLVFGSEDGWIYLVNAADGSEVWSYDIGQAITASPAVSDGRILIGAEDGVLYAFGDRQEARASSYSELTVHARPNSLALGATTEDWPRFLGPRQQMVSAETPLLKAWDESGPPLVWERFRGEGFSSPVIAQGRLVYHHRVDDKEVVECLDPQSGRRYWAFRYPTDYVDRYGYNGGPRATPCIADSKVYTVGVEGVLHCLSLEQGEVLWQRSLTKDYGLKQGFFGFGASPIVYGDMVILNVGAPGGPSVVAFDTQDGRVIWSGGEKWGSSYATPVVAPLRGRPTVLVFAGGESRPPVGGLMALDAQTGTPAFDCPWRSSRYESVNASSPVVFGDRIYVSYAIRGQGALVQANRENQVETVWANAELGAYWMTPVYHQGFLYGIDGESVAQTELVCLDAESGAARWRVAPRWTESVPDGEGTRQLNLGIGRGHLVKADGDWLCLGEFGHLLWLALSPEGCDILQRSWLFRAQQTFVPPVVSHGLLYVVQNSRTQVEGIEPRLLCYDLRGESPSHLQ
jgi:outer membrane protein assembly factor BamB